MAIIKVKWSEYKAILSKIDPHSIYCWGGNADKPLSSLTEAKIKDLENSTANANRVIKMWNKYRGYEKATYCDCSGFILFPLRQLGACGDMTANGIKGHCVQIAKAELSMGDMVFKVYKSGANKGKAYHIGVVVDETGTIWSSKGRDSLVPYKNETGWNYYARPTFFEFDKPKKSKGIAVKRNLKKGHKGEDVRAMQTALLKLNYNFGKYGADGSFGSATLKTLKQFQKDQHIAVDGIAGKNSIGKLEKLTEGILYWAK